VEKIGCRSSLPTTPSSTTTTLQTEGVTTNRYPCRLRLGDKQLERDDKDAWDRSLWGPTNHIWIAILYGLVKGTWATILGLLGFGFGAAILTFVLSLPGAAFIAIIGAIGGENDLGFWEGYARSATYVGYAAVPLAGLAALAYGISVGARQFVYANGPSLSQCKSYDNELIRAGDTPRSDSRSTTITIREVRLESHEGCPKCPRNPDEPFDFLSDELAHSDDGTHVLVWAGSVPIASRYDPFGVHETCTVIVKGLIAAKPYMEDGVGYRFGVASPQMTTHQREQLGLTSPPVAFRYRCVKGGPNGVASEIGRIIAKFKCQLSKREINTVLDGLDGNNRKLFFIDMTLSRI
jgi:hypothetical protein